MIGQPENIMNTQLSSLTREANQGDIEAQFQLAELYAGGVGVAPDKAQAAYWYLKAAEQNSGKAQARLGQMYLDGAGVAEDHAQAIIWLEKSAR